MDNFIKTKIVYPWPIIEAQNANADVFKIFFIAAKE